MTDQSRISEAHLAITSAALAGDPGGLYDIVGGVLDEGIPFETVLFDLLVPTERVVGDRWQSGDYLAAEEHAATATIETVIALLAGSFDQPEDAQHIVVASAEGDSHSLVGRAIAAHLLQLGYRTTFLGANVLASDLRDYLIYEKPDALVLSCTMAPNLIRARATVQAAHDAGVPVAAGGRAFGASSARSVALGVDALVEDAASVAATLEKWNPDPSSAEALASVPDEELERLLESHNLILGQAQVDLGEQDDPRFRDELDWLLAAVESALLVEDPQLVADYQDWQKSILESHGYPDIDLSATLARHLAPISPRGAEFLTSSA